jgi:hypothetical protein
MTPQPIQFSPNQIFLNVNDSLRQLPEIPPRNTAVTTTQPLLNSAPVVDHYCDAPRQIAAVG